MRPRRGRVDGIMIFNGMVAVAVGAISGRYIFKQPLEDYWKQKAAEQAASSSASTTNSQTQQQQSSPPSKT
ncbi:expressed unknown protein [Seminavis robusta]|uniref:Uncharacterized protein n=1 Tax=Seminavis robusta TaxID=568900 RepID=A0A9N8DZ82_9STRA|nr:expressed unknown protein [Seminavis robusta]|eukprot:Sro493_g154180.1 n/a (71) ;mRNA; f:53974-54279